MLGQMISNKRDNSAHISALKNKSIGIIKKIFNYLESLKLGQYYFECSIILMKSLLRGSLLYSIETLYNLTEKEIRDIEKIEEDYLRRLYSSVKTCPISQLYLDSGVYPLRYDIMKIQILFYYYIMNEKKDSLIYKFLEAQKQYPVKGDWYTLFQSSMKSLELNISDNEFQDLTKNQLKTILKNTIAEKSLLYLLNLRKKKGSEIIYKELKMANYLLPNRSNLSIKEKQILFSYRNKTNNIPANFQSSDIKIFCGTGCGCIENMEHIYICENLNIESEKRKPYCEIYNGDLKTQIEIFRIMKTNIERREQIIMNNISE